MPAISLLIKPVSSSCNMRCAYCFYADVAHSRSIADYGKMSEETLETIIQKALALADGGPVTFGFQGGEPTLAGLPFFQKAVALQKEHNHKNSAIQNALQTNGLLLDSQWAEFFRDNHFLIGISLDGTPPVHDCFRLDAKGKGTFERVLESAHLLERCQVEFNILSTVNAEVAKNVEKIYYFFKKQGFRYLQFIPCLDELKGPGNQNYSLTAEAYGDFLIRLFGLWYVDWKKGTPTSIRWFDNLVMMAGGYPPESCGMSGRCSCYYMVEADGSVFPCDFYVTDEWRLGNILTDDMAGLLETENAKRFIQVSEQVAEDCRACPHYALCRGGCRRNREPISLTVNGPNVLCEAYRRFFSSCRTELERMSDQIFHGRTSGRNGARNAEALLK